MKINTQFTFKDKVLIKELKISGIVVGIYMGCNYNVQYEVRIFKDNEPKTIYFHEFELEIYKEGIKEVGFNKKV